MEIQKVKTENRKYLNKDCFVTTVYLTKNPEGKRLVVREFEDEWDISLIEGYHGRYERKIPFRSFEVQEAELVHKMYLDFVEEQD